MAVVLSKPSALIHEIQIEKVGTWNLFKFSESLQLRMENLLEKKKDDALSPEDVAELDSIGELDSRRRGYANEFLAISMPRAHQIVPISEATKQSVRERAKYLCEYCHSLEILSANRLTIDHIVPSSLGGSDDRG